MGIKLKDMSKVEAWSTTQMLDLGLHTVQITEAVESESKDGDHPVIELTFVSKAGLGQIRDWLHITDGSLGKVRQLLDAVEIEATDDMELSGSALTGKSLYIRVAEKEKYNDPSMMQKFVSAYISLNASDVPADTADLKPAGGGGNGTSDDDPLPF